MSQANFLYDEKGGVGLGTVEVAADYTIRTGRTDDGQVIDRVVKIADPSANIALTLPDGTFIGQTILVTFYSNDDSKQATLTVTHHESGDSGSEPLDAVDEYMYFIWTGTEWATISYSTAGDIA